MNYRDDKRALTGIGRWALAGLVMSTAMMGFVSLVSAEGGNVRYSYEEARIAGDRQFVLVPRAESQLSGEVTAATLEAAFEALRRAKPPTYGNSYASVSGNVPDNARVEVHIDSNYSDYAPIIMAEAVYTLTEYGIDEVHFPDHASGGLSRADISFAAYTLTVPLWKVVPPGQVTTAQILMPDGELLPTTEINRRWNSDREGVIDDVYAFLDASDDYTVRSVVRALPDVGDLRLDDVLPLLAHDTRSVRQATLRTLEGLEDNSAVLEAVATALDAEGSGSLARRMAEFLGESQSDDFNVLLQFYLVENGDDEEAQSAATALREWDGDDRVVELLSQTLRDERTEVAMAAAASLDGLQAHSPRGDALDDMDVAADVRRQLSEDLADESNPDAVRLVGLTYITQDRRGGYANQAISTMAQLPIDDAREKVEEYLTNRSADQRRTAINALRDRNEVASVEALMDAAEEQAEAVAMREAAYDIMVAQSLNEIIEQTGAASTQVQQVAYQAIGERARRDGEQNRSVATIDEATGHRVASIRAAAARSLGEIGGDDALETLATMTDDGDAGVRRAVALALGRFSGTDHADVLVNYLGDDDPGVVAGAIDALEQREDPREADQIQGMVRHDDPQIRASALRAVTTFLSHDDEDSVRRHMGLLSGAVSDDDPNVQKVALAQLGRFETSMSVTNIATQVGSDNTDVRLAAIRALADTGHGDAQPLIESALSDDEPVVRREAVDALMRLAGSAARAELEARMEEEDDPEVRDFIQNQLQQI